MSPAEVVVTLLKLPVTLAGEIDGNVPVLGAAIKTGAEPTNDTARMPGWGEEHEARSVRTAPGGKALNQAVALAGINLLMHYILEGEAANRRPVPWFDPAWYRTQYHVPAERLALAHYIEHRHCRTVSPNPLFDVEWYVIRHGAVACRRCRSGSVRYCA